MDDFQAYMETLAQKQAAENDYAEMISAHQQWLDKSWGGLFVRTTRKVSENKFIIALTDSLRDQENGASAPSRLLTNIARLLVVVMGVIAVFVIGKISQYVIGGDIVLEQEVLVIEEVRRSELKETENGQTKSTTRRRRSAREKSILQ